MIHLFFLSTGAGILAQNPPPQPGVGKPLTRSSESEIDTGGVQVGRKEGAPQLRVMSDNLKARAHFSAYSRDLRLKFRNRLGLYTDESDDWTSNLFIRVFGSSNDVYSGVETLLNGERDAGLKFSLWLDVRLHDRFDENNFRVELIRMLFYDQMLEIYRNTPDQVSSKNMEVPDWLVYGLEYSLRHKELGRPSYFYSGYLKNGQLINPTDIVKPNRAQGLTPIQLEIFRASAAILVDALCDQKDGLTSMRALLGELAKKPNADCLQLIMKHFPAFRETNLGIDKWWALQLATMSQQQVFEFLSPEETQKHLDAALKVKIAEYKVPLNQRKLFPVKTKGGSKLFDRIKKQRDEKTEPDDIPEPPKTKVKPAFEGTLADYHQFTDHPGYENIIIGRFNALNSVKVKAFPLYRDVIEQYILLCSSLSKPKKVSPKEIANKLNKINSIKEQIDTVLPQCNDYMNFFEATQTPKRSQAFENYIKFKDETRTKTKMSDPLTKYFDEVEAILSEPAN